MANQRLAKCTVYVVDDDQAMLDAISVVADCVGLDVSLYSSPFEFLKSYQPDKPGCLMLDVRMNEMNGLELQEKLKQQGIDLPIVFMTAHADVQMAVDALKAGALDFLEKPFSEQQWINSVHKAFEEDTLRRQCKSRKNRATRNFSTLSIQEQEAMRRLVEGESAEDIAANLAESHGAAEKLCHQVMLKMQASSLADLVRIAVDLDFPAPSRAS